MFLSFKRIFSSGFKNFARQLSASASSIFVMATVIVLLTSIFYVDALGNAVFENMQQRIGIIAYLEEGVSAEQVSFLREKIKTFPGIEDVIYTSKEEALAEFQEENKNDETVIQSLEIVGENPFPASLRVKGTDLESYESANTFLTSDENTPFIESVTFPRTEESMENIFALFDNIKKIGYGLSIFLAIVAFIIVSSAVKLAVHSSKEEISVMRTVGASNSFVFGPYLVHGVITGIISAIIAIVFYAGISYFAAPSFSAIVGNSLDFFAFYKANFIKLFSFDLLVGILMGIIFNYFAVRQYLKV